jgi:hypothetical protein
MACSMPIFFNIHFVKACVFVCIVLIDAYDVYYVKLNGGFIEFVVQNDPHSDARDKDAWQNRGVLLIWRKHEQSRID